MDEIYNGDLNVVSVQNFENRWIDELDDLLEGLLEFREFDFVKVLVDFNKNSAQIFRKIYNKEIEPFTV